METMNQSQSGATSTFVLKHTSVKQNRTYDYIYGKSEIITILEHTQTIFFFFKLFRQKLPFI